MRSLVLLLTVFGAAVGLLPLALDLLEQAFSVPDVEYDAFYEPLPGVEFSRSYTTSLDLHGRSLDWFDYCAPVVGGAMGAVLAFVLHRQGFRFTKGSQQ